MSHRGENNNSSTINGGNGTNEIAKDNCDKVGLQHLGVGFEGKIICVYTFFLTPLFLLIIGLPPENERLSYLAFAFIFWWIQAFGIFVGYHRLFSHHSFKCQRWFMSLLALMGCLASQRGPIWWASMHRNHHKNCDEEGDDHSPYSFGPLTTWRKKWEGFWWAHSFFLWYKGFPDTKKSLVPDLLKYPELVLIDKWAELIYFIPAPFIYLWGGWTAIVWVFFGAHFMSHNAVLSVNSLCHITGTREFECPLSKRCNATNVWWLSFYMLGDNWHNNHHADMHAVTTDKWYKLDINYHFIYFLSFFGITYDLVYPKKDKLKVIDQSLPRPDEKGHLY